MVRERNTARFGHRPLRPARRGPCRRSPMRVLALAATALVAGCSSPSADTDRPSDRELFHKAKSPSLDESTPGVEVRPSAAAHSLLDKMVTEQRRVEADPETKQAEEVPAILRDEPAAATSLEKELDSAAIDREIRRAIAGQSDPLELPSPGDPVALADPLPKENPTESGAANPSSPTLRSAAAQEQPAQEQPAQESPEQERPVPEQKPRPEGKIAFFRFFHKTSSDFTRFLASDFRDMIENRHVAEVNGKPRNVMFFGDDATLLMLEGLASQFDEMNLEIEQVAIRPKYIGVDTLLQSLTLASVANVWDRVEESITTQQITANKWKTIGVLKHDVYTPGGISQGNEAPTPVAPKVPYVFAKPARCRPGALTRRLCPSRG